MTAATPFHAPPTLSAVACFSATHAPQAASLKDIDACGFVLGFPAAQQAVWLDWMRRLRRADELAETDPVAFAALRAAWEASRDFGPPGQQRIADAWSRYLTALAEYHAPGLVIRTLAEHDEMLLRLSGPLLQLAPGMPEELWEAAAHLGAMDQFYNNLRDLQEDAERGLCWLPEEVLLDHGLTREDVISGRAADKVWWRSVVVFWLGTHGRQLRRRAGALVEMEYLPRAIEAMIAWTVARYERIERVLRDVGYDYRLFPKVYWAEVRRELAGRWLDEGEMR